MDIFPKLDLEELYKNCELALEGARLVGSFIAPTSVNVGQQLDLITKSSVVKRLGCLETTLTLARTKHAIFAAPLLRPAIEENFWLTYLWSLSKFDAEEIVNAKNWLEMCQLIKASMGFYSSEQVDQLNLAGAKIDRILNLRSRAESMLQRIGAQQRWQLRKNQYLPSTFKIAEFVGKSDQYEFLYRATSKVVHFSPHELYRMVWGNRVEVSISTEHYAKYWSAFTLYWQFKLWGELFEVVVQSLDFGDTKYDISSEVLDAYDWLGRFPPPPIFTAAELHWPE